MTDSMKFGPEWLRNLSAEGNTTSSSSGGSRYYLADHRYGREEMLALFDQSLKLRPPSSMENFPTLFISQPLHPLALAPMTEDETRLWTGRSAPQGAPRGRGGSMDRGRGRGRGGTFHPGFTRSSSTYDEPLRPFDRTQSDRGWSERNGDLGEWGVSTSPRKEYGSNRGASNNSDNWRKHRTEDCDTDGWRSSNHRTTSIQEKWTGSSGRSISSNWRDGDSRDDHGHLGDRPGPTSNRVTWHSGSDVSRGPPHRRPWDMEDHLPEWATENPSESGGTFDASGAFHGSDDEAPPEKNAPSSRTSRETSSSLQKSASQHNIQSAKKPTPLSTSQSATNLMKKAEEPPKEIINSKEKVEEKPPVIKETKKKEEERITKPEVKESKPDVQPSLPAKKDEPREPTSDPNNMQICRIEMIKDSQSSTSDSSSNKVDDEFDHMKEVTDDIVAKLILDDEPMKAVTTTTGEPQRSVGGGGAVAPLSYTAGLQSVLGNAPPSSMAPPPGTGQDKWYYRDPQGEVQGPFTSQEMAEWFRAGYFTISLFVRRQCDERYFTLGELVKQCPGVPFLNCRLPPLKAQADPMTMALGKVSTEIGDPALLQRTLHMHLLRQAEAIRTLSETEPWGSLSHLQQRELVTQHMMAQPPVLTEMPYVAPLPNTQITNPLLHMLSQMQQANKLPGQPSIVEKPPNSIPTQHLDPLQQLVQQMGGLQTNMGPTITNMVPTQPPASAANNTPQLDPNSQQPDDAIKSLLRQLANQSEQRDIWDVRRSQAPPPFPAQPAQPWMGNVAPAAGIPHSMWDLHIQNSMPVIPPPIVTPTSIAMNPQAQITAAPPNITRIPSIINQPITNHQPSPPVTTATPPALPSTIPEPQLNNTIPTSTIEHKDHEKEQKKKAEQEREQKQKERKEAAEKEKKRKEQEQQEKLKAQREAEEKRKEEQKKKEAEKKAEAERQKREAERARKEMEKAKREAEEKKARELEEKKKLKEQKKAVEEAKKKAEEERKKEEEEKQRKEAERREEQSRRQAEALKKMQEQQQQQRTKVAPWCQAAVAAATTNNTSLSLAEIQRAEKEKRAEQTALLLQQQKLAAAKEQEQQVQEKSSLNLKWAKKSTLPKKVKPLAEIQAEEQERAARQAAEARLAQQQKERELPPQPAAHTSIWSTASQSLTWVTNTHTTGFWDDSPAVQKMPNKPTPAAPKSNSNNQVTQQQNNTNNKANVKTNNKSKAKKEEQQAMKLFEKNGPTTDEFTSWCIKTLSALKGEVDVPTFVAFLRDVESPYDVKDYVRQYYGDTTQAMHFANQFVERRCKVNDQQRAAMQYKDDLCQPAPAITPSTEFQEVKGKGKKTKKSKMMKVDSRCLGFSVTAAEDRINVGDRDYGDSI